jgi:hypothetical protein
MTVHVRLTALLATVVASLASPATPPRCIGDLIAGESGARARLSAPSVTPLRGRTGTLVEIRGGGFEPGAHLTIAAVYGDDGCAIGGLGDQYLGSARADGRGRYSLLVRWPASFDPVLGRNAVGTRALPHGRYYLFALPCAARAACSFTSGTRPGGPFVLGARRSARASPLPWIGAGVVIVLLGVLFVRRRSSR